METQIADTQALGLVVQVRRRSLWDLTLLETTVIHLFPLAWSRAGG